MPPESTVRPAICVWKIQMRLPCPEIPFAEYNEPIVQTSQDRRRELFESKADHLFEIEIYYSVLIEGSRSKTGIRAALAQLFGDPAGGLNELKKQFSNRDMKILLRREIERDLARLGNQVQAFVRQLADFVRIEVLDYRGQFHLLRRLLNYDDWRIAGEPESSQFLCNQIHNSEIRAERDHLRVGDDFVRILTMKEAVGETRPLSLDALLKIPANFIAISEWVPLSAAAARKEWEGLP